MIQAITETDLTAYIQTEDNRIDTSVASDKIRHLIKFTNDMSGAVAYNSTSDVYTGDINLKPAGYWKYEAYEVSWTGAVAISSGNAPVNENDVLPVAPTHGVVQGLVTKGKMYVADKSGTEQVQYTQHPEPSGSNYIYYGQ